MWNFSTELNPKYRPGYEFQSSFEVTQPHFLKYNVMRSAGCQEVMFLPKKYLIYF